MLPTIYVSYYFLKTLQCYSSSTGDATQYLRFPVFPVRIMNIFSQLALCSDNETATPNPRHVTSAPEDRTWHLSFRRRAIRGAMDSIVCMLIFQSRPNYSIHALTWTQGESKDRHRFAQWQTTSTEKMKRIKIARKVTIFWESRNSRFPKLSSILVVNLEVTDGKLKQR